MSRPPERAYSFTTATHWQLGARLNFELEHGRLGVPPPRCLHLLADTGIQDGSALAAVDACDRLTWLRPDTGEVVRRHPFGPQTISRLHPEPPILDMVIGPTVLWLLRAGGQVERRNAVTLRRLGLLPAVEGWEPVSLTGSGGDGIWVIERGRSDQSLRMRKVDCWGRSCRREVRLPDSPTGHVRQVVSAPDGSLVALLDGAETTRLTIIDLEPMARASVTQGPVEPGPEVDEGRAAGATLVAVSADRRVHLLTPQAPGDTILLQTVAPDGQNEHWQELPLPSALGTVVGVVATDPLVLIGTDGMAELAACEGEGEVRTSTFVTPLLIPPDVVEDGWDRIEIDVDLPPGTAMEVAWTTARSETHRRQIEERRVGYAGPWAETVAESLPWSPQRTVRYEAAGPTPVGPERLAMLIEGGGLDPIWVRVRLLSPPDRLRPTLLGLQVIHPMDSYLEHLPAAYRLADSHAKEDPGQQLRRVLAPIEVLFDRLDRELAALPDRIHPASAPDHSTADLLSWLGFPPLGDLEVGARRRLLTEAADLLVRRGTVGALQRVLEIVTGVVPTIDERLTRNQIWQIGTGETTTEARLGTDTVVSAQNPPPFRAGRVRMGATPLGLGCTDPALLEAQQSGAVRIGLDLDEQQRSTLRPIIDRLLRMLVPAHCRVELTHSGLDGRWSAERLDQGLRLAPPEPADDHSADSESDLVLLAASRLYGPEHWRLGATTGLGQWRLPDQHVGPVVLDDTVFAPERTYLI